MTTRTIKESPKYQGEDERIAYKLDTANWGGYDSDAACVLKDEKGRDVSSTYLTGAISTSTDYITSPLVIDLIPGKTYRLEFLWVYLGNTFESILEIYGEE